MKGELWQYHTSIYGKMIDKDINKTQLCQETGISAATMAKMSKDEPVTLTTIEKICDFLNCNLEDVVDITHENRIV